MIRRIGRESPRAGVRWIVDEASPRTLGEVLIALGEPAHDALIDGRVFVARRRAIDLAQALDLGDLVEVYPERPDRERRVRLLGEANGLYVFEKPPELPTEPDRTGSVLTMRALAARELGFREDHLHAANRLDVGVSGLVLFALGRAGQKHVVKLRERAAIRRRYLAIATRAPEPIRGTWSTAVDRRKAETRYSLVRCAESEDAATPDGLGMRAALLALEPVTGRTHQLRVHAERAGAPLLGDRAHGGPARVILRDGRVKELDRIALHAARVRIMEPSGPVDFTSPVPAELVELWRELGGNAVAFDLGMNASF
jgi:23S rRNA pseudouridine955/2504/2580 synthase/23S rRNA pseudouridine1911/1915/1917 synthase